MIIPDGKSGSQSSSGRLPPAVDLILREIAHQVQRLAIAQNEDAQDNLRSSQLIARQTADDLSKALRTVAENLEAGLAQTQNAITSLAQTETRQKLLVDAMFDHMCALTQAQSLLNNVKNRCSSSLQKASSQADKTRAILCLAENLSSNAMSLEDETRSLGALFNSWSTFISVAQKLQGNLYLDSHKARNCLTSINAAASKSVYAVESAKKEFTQLEKMVTSIASIIDVINSIAEKTNILSLNMSIEATRAGDQGQSFTIIADNLRKLAERSVSCSGDALSKMESLTQVSKTTMSALQEGYESLRVAIAFLSESEASIDRMNNNVSQMSKLSSDIDDQLCTGRNLCHSTIHQCGLISKNSHEISESTQFMIDLFRTDKNLLHGIINYLQDIEKRLQSEVTTSESILLQQQDLEGQTSRAHDISLGLSLALFAAQVESQSALTLAENTNVALVQQDLPKNKNVNEIKEQLGQCAQEILKLVDTPSEARMVS